MNLKSQIYLKTRIDHGSIRFGHQRNCSSAISHTLSPSTHCQSLRSALNSFSWPVCKRSAHNVHIRFARSRSVGVHMIRMLSHWPSPGQQSIWTRTVLFCSLRPPKPGRRFLVQALSDRSASLCWSASGNGILASLVDKRRRRTVTRSSGPSCRSID